MAKTLASLLLFLQLTSFIAFAEDLESLHTPARLHPPANAPHHHRHHHNPSLTPTHTPLHPPHPAKPPTHHHHHHHAPTPVPVYKPLPVHAPAPSPVRTPLRQIPHPRSLLAVQGVVYVKSCKHAGVDTLLGATSLHGAVVKLQCNNTKHNVILKGKTNKNGYFYIEGSNDISSFAAHKCNVVLVSAPNGLKPSNLHGGIVGAALKAKKSFVSKGHPFILYNVGPFAFEPKCTH